MPDEPVVETPPVIPDTPPVFDWKTPLSDDLKTNPEWLAGAEKVMGEFKDYGGVVKSLVDTKKMVGSAREGMIALPKDDMPEEQKVQIRREILGKIGMLPPDSPDGYTVTLPEGVPMDEERLKFYRPYLHQLGLTQDQVQGIVAADANFQMANIRRLQDDVMLKKDTLQKEWGILYGRNEALAVAGLEHYFGEDGMKMLHETGLINHPSLIRAGYKIGWTLPEDKLVMGQFAGGENVDSINAKIEAINFDKNNPDYQAIARGDPNDPIRTQALEKLRGLVLAKGQLEKVTKR